MERFQKQASHAHAHIIGQALIVENSYDAYICQNAHIYQNAEINQQFKHARLSEIYSHVKFIVANVENTVEKGISK